MKSIQRGIVLGGLFAILYGCGVTERSATKPPSTTSVYHKVPSTSSPAMGISKYKEVEASLKQAYRDWKGTPYVLGGSSLKGIDCSAFMQRIFIRYFGIKLPRNTKRQLYAGTGVRRNALETGDLVFFKTGRKTLHVGVIIKGDEFLHASTSEGVTTSSLDDTYWQSRYLAARRILKLR